MPMNICIHYVYFSDADTACGIYSSEHKSYHPGYLYTTEGIATTSLDCFDVSYHTFTSLLLISITKLGSVISITNLSRIPVSQTEGTEEIVHHYPVLEGWGGSSLVIPQTLLQE